MARWVKDLLVKHDDLISNSGTQVKLGHIHPACNPKAGCEGQRWVNPRDSLTSQYNQFMNYKFSEKPCLRQGRG